MGRHFSCGGSGARTLPLLREFRYSEVQSATSNFHPSAFLGRGSHSSVFLARLDGGHLPAAAKLPSPLSPSPTNEVDVLSSSLRGRRHPRLVNLLGSTPDRLIAVVELMPNGSLHDLLHPAASPASPPPPHYARRVRLAVQVAEAVRALHSLHPPVIHRDIKPSNVLLDAAGDARLSDFGLAIRCRSQDHLNLGPPPAGTLGYLDPAYAAPADLSTKSDVFSFGVLLLEMVSGRRAIDVDHSPASVRDWAAPMIERGEFDCIWDPRIGLPGEEGRLRDVMIDVVVVAGRCVGAEVEKRPEMSEVVRWLRAAGRKAAPPPPWRMWWSSRSRKGKRTPSKTGRVADAAAELEDAVAGG